jgi:hypothetical protein
MSVKRILAAVTTACAVSAASLVATGGTALARESSLSNKDGCYIWTGNVTKPTASSRAVTVSVRCPYNHTVSYAYVGLYKDVSRGSDTMIGSNGTIFAVGTRLTANTTYTRTVSWGTSAGPAYARFTFKNSSWTFPVVVESWSNT